MNPIKNQNPVIHISILEKIIEKQNKSISVFTFGAKEELTERYSIRVWKASFNYQFMK